MSVFLVVLETGCIFPWLATFLARDTVSRTVLSSDHWPHSSGCHMSCVVCHVYHVICHVSYVVWRSVLHCRKLNWPPSSLCHVSCVVCHVSHVMWNGIRILTAQFCVSYVMCNMSPVTCHLLCDAVSRTVLSSDHWPHNCGYHVTHITCHRSCVAWHGA